MWVAAVALTPAADRPFVGGTQNNSVVSLIFGYNGFGRLGTQAVNMNGNGLERDSWARPASLGSSLADYGNMMSWLLPGSPDHGRHSPRANNPCRAHRPRARRALLWGGSLLVIGLAISLSPGITTLLHRRHGTLAGALFGISATGLWRRRRWLTARIGLFAAGLGATVVWSCVLLGRTPEWFPVLRPSGGGRRHTRGPCHPGLASCRAGPQARCQPRGSGPL